ncbi:MAG: aminopeptidase N [Alphaproteobacteria bacterium]|nr:aminopeptidase N [Alphaproteobacteria bacterium]
MIYRKDYKKPEYEITSIDLEFTLHPTETKVHSVIKGKRTVPHSITLPLNGKYFKLLSISLNGELLSAEDYTKTKEMLSLQIGTESFEIECETLVNAKENTSLSGLYMSNGIFCTQCEAEGFRNITYYPDHPDIMTRFTTTIHADRKTYPVLLSNGNKVKDIGDTVVWEDPFPKPCYLFALVAGKLDSLEDSFTTRSGRNVALRLFCEPDKKERLSYAIGALKRAMRWDEQAFDREYDLDLFNIVAVSDFNAGAMENKSLNIFNDSCLLAKIDTTTDVGFLFIESVVGHEYFHNWSGDRVTAQSWFNLSLKEGFTVYRDQEFSRALHSASVNRIDDVLSLKLYQYPEDDGPLAHPVRPEQYMTIDNFYTSTVYNKGAELIRMQATILGEDNFKDACNLYFSRFDGQAVTIDDFVACMQEKSPVDLTQFMNWYSIAGRPKVSVKETYLKDTETYEITLCQETKNTDALFMIPLKFGLLDKKGNEIQSGLLIFKDKKQTFTFNHIKERPVLSLNRDFSAPVDILFEQTKEEKALLMQKDTDLFNRFEMGQTYATEVLLEMIEKDKTDIDSAFLTAFSSYLTDYEKDKAFTARALTLPLESFLEGKVSVIDVENIHEKREALRTAFALQNEKILRKIYKQENSFSSNTSLEDSAIASRALKNVVLGYLTLLGDTKLALSQFKKAQNMTDKFTALSLLMTYDYEAEGKKASEAFFKDYKNDHLVLNKWLALQGMVYRKTALEEIKALTKEDFFDIKNPNKVRGLVGSFTRNRAFHFPDGKGYDFLADIVLRLDNLNPQAAQRILVPLTKYERYKKELREKMKASLTRINQTKNISTNIFETTSRALHLKEQEEK